MLDLNLHNYMASDYEFAVNFFPNYLKSPEGRSIMRETSQNNCEVRIWTVVVAVVSRWYPNMLRRRVAACCLYPDCPFGHIRVPSFASTQRYTLE